MNEYDEEMFCDTIDIFELHDEDQKNSFDLNDFFHINEKLMKEILNVEDDFDEFV